MTESVIDERDQSGFVQLHLAVDFDRHNAMANAGRVFDNDFVVGAAISHRHFVSAPGLGDTGINQQILALEPSAENSFKRDTVGPARRAGVPCPAATTGMWRHRIHITSNNIGLYLISLGVREVASVVDRID